MINACVEYRAPSGWSRFGWMNGIKNALSKGGLNVESAVVRAINSNE